MPLSQMTREYAVSQRIPLPTPSLPLWAGSLPTPAPHLRGEMERYPLTTSTKGLGERGQQYARMVRGGLRLFEPYRSSVDFDDDLLHFLMDCWHLKDWIKNDAKLALDATAREAVEKNDFGSGKVTIDHYITTNDGETNT